jgi:hypothetical protein
MIDKKLVMIIGIVLLLAGASYAARIVLFGVNSDGTVVTFTSVKIGLFLKELLQLKFWLLQEAEEAEEIVILVEVQVLEELVVYCIIHPIL